MNTPVETRPHVHVRMDGNADDLFSQCTDASLHLHTLANAADMVAMLREWVSEGRHANTQEQRAQFYATLATLDDLLQSTQGRTIAVVNLIETLANAATRSQIPEEYIKP